MIRECPECRGKVSDQATSCPHCGFPLSTLATAPTAAGKKSKSAPVFMVLALFGLFVCLFTPRILVALPVLLTAGAAVVSLFRRERARIVSNVVLIAAVGILLLSGSNAGTGADPSALSAVEVVDWNWRADPSFGTKGTVRWNARIRNKSQKYIENVRLELTTFDGSGQLIATTFTFVSAIPPGETRSDESFADYYGTEKKAQLQVTDVRFSAQ